MPPLTPEQIDLYEAACVYLHDAHDRGIVVTKQRCHCLRTATPQCSMSWGDNRQDL